MEVDGVFASDDVSDSAALGLAGGLLGGGHFCDSVSSRSRERGFAELRKTGARLLAIAGMSLAVYVLTEIGCGLVDGEIEMRRESSRKPRSPGRFAICVRSLNPLAVLEKSGARMLHASASRTTNHQHRAN